MPVTKAVAPPIRMIAGLTTVRAWGQSVLIVAPDAPGGGVDPGALDALLSGAAAAAPCLRAPFVECPGPLRCEPYGGAADVFALVAGLSLAAGGDARLLALAGGGERGALRLARGDVAGIAAGLAPAAPAGGPDLPVPDGRASAFLRWMLDGLGGAASRRLAAAALRCHEEGGHRLADAVAQLVVAAAWAHGRAPQTVVVSPAHQAAVLRDLLRALGPDQPGARARSGPAAGRPGALPRLAPTDPDAGPGPDRLPPGDWLRRVAGPDPREAARWWTAASGRIGRWLGGGPDGDPELRRRTAALARAALAEPVGLALSAFCGAGHRAAGLRVGDEVGALSRTFVAATLAPGRGGGPVFRLEIEPAVRLLPVWSELVVPPGYRWRVSAVHEPDAVVTVRCTNPGVFDDPAARERLARRLEALPEVPGAAWWVVD